MSPRINARKLLTFYQNFASEFAFGSLSISMLDAGQKLQQEMFGSNFAAASSCALYNQYVKSTPSLYQEFMSGFTRYIESPYLPRDNANMPVLGQCGSVLLRHYGSQSDTSLNRPPIIFVPSLINRGYIFDLLPQNSLFSFLHQNGFQPWLIDWGKPESDEQHFDINQYVEHRLVPLLRLAAKFSPTKPVLVGYCLGGLMTLKALKQYQEVQGLALFAVPWQLDHYQQSTSIYKTWLNFLKPDVNDVQSTGQYDLSIPHHWQQLYFHSLDFVGVMKKFQPLAESNLSQTQLQHFVTVEDWLNDGVPLASRVAHQLITASSSLETDVTQSAWSFSPEHLPSSIFTVIPDRDKIVPAAAAEALLQYLPSPQVLRPDLGHIGMIISSRAPELVWKPFEKWLQTLY